MMILLAGLAYSQRMNKEKGFGLRATIKRKVIEASKLLDNQHDNVIDKINFHLDVGQESRGHHVLCPSFGPS